MALEKATFAGGCFWCTEAVFEQVRGVERVVSGYTGGTVPSPSYEQVGTGLTGHAEAIQISFDPKAISYEELVRLFFAFHDPTTLNRQGPDTGTQYRSAVFHHSEAQHRAVESVIAELVAADTWDDAVVTEVLPLDEFYPAEPHQQAYYRRNPSQPYCQTWATPKVAKLRGKFRQYIKA